MIPRRRRQGFSTVALHGGRDTHDTDTPIVQPIFQSVNYVQEPGTGEGAHWWIASTNAPHPAA